MSLHPIQLNFAALINNETLSDITLKATMFDETKCDQNDDEQQLMNIDNSTDENKFDESNISLISSLDDNDIKQVNAPAIKRSIDGSIDCHWDIIRARCIVFDLIFHAISNDKLDQLPTTDMNNNIFHVDIESNIIHFDVCYDALLIIVKFLYTGLIRRYQYEDIKIAHDVVQLANILHLDALRTDINGQFLFSRKQLKDDELSSIDNDNDDLNEWRAMKMESFNFDDWNKKNSKYFLNSNVLYHYNDEMYKNVGSRQLIRINERTFQISKIIFVSVSEYFKAMFIGHGGSWKESQNDQQTVIEMKQINADDFEILQEFLYTFDQSNYYDGDHGKLNDYDFDHETETKHSQKKKELLNRTINALHLSIFFGIDDLRQALLLIIDKYYLCKNTLYPFWNLGYEYQLNDIKELCSNYLAHDFGNISCDQEIFFGLNKRMIKEGLSGGKIRVNTDHMIRVLLEWANHHQTSIQELLPPNTLFNQANKNYVLCNRRAMNLQHLMRL